MAESERAPRKRRIVRRMLWTLLVAELVWVMAFEVAVRSGSLARWIDRRPEKIRIAFESAHSWFPGRVSVAGLELHGQSPRVRWRATMERASGWISPLALARRTVRFVAVRAHGGTVAVRRELERPPEQLPLLAPIDALPQPATPRPPSTRPKWSFEIAGASAEGLREVWIERARFVGRFDAAGGFAMRSGRELEVTPSRATFDGVEVRVGDVAVGRGLAGEAAARIDRYPFREKRGLLMLPFLSGTAEVRGRLSERALLETLLAAAPWLEFGDSEGDVRARLVVEEGRLEPGTRIAFEHENFETRAFRSRATGDATVTFDVVEGAARAGAEGRLAVHYDDFEIHSPVSERPEIVGTGLVLEAHTPHLELARAVEDARIHIDLGEARIPDLSVYDSLIPPASGLAIVSGSGKVAGSFDADLAANDGRGAFVATIDDAAVRYRDLDLSGRVALTLNIRGGDLRERKFDVSTTRLELHDFRSPQAELAHAPAADSGWWAAIELADATLKLPPEATLDAKLDVGLRDSVPIVGIFESRKNLPRWVERLLTVSDIRAGGRLAWKSDETALEEVATRFRSSTIRARVRFGKERRVGLLLVEWKKLALGLRVENEKKKFKFVGVRKWFAATDLDSPMPSSSSAGSSEELLGEEALRQAELPARTGDDAALVSVAEPTGEGDPAGGDDEGVGLDLVPGSVVRGDLDDDADEEAAALVRGAGDPSALRVVAFDVDGGRARATAVWEAPAGARVEGLAIEGGAIRATIHEAGEDRGLGLTWRPPAGPELAPLPEPESAEAK